jgi:hypothetical protein
VLRHLQYTTRAATTKRGSDHVQSAANPSLHLHRILVNAHYVVDKLAEKLTYLEHTSWLSARADPY